MSPRKTTPREIQFADIEAAFQVESCWLGARWCPAVHRRGADYVVRVLPRLAVTASGDKRTYDYPGDDQAGGDRFEHGWYDFLVFDADGSVAVVPRGYAKDYKPGRVPVGQLKEAVERYAVPDPAAPRFTVGGAG
jgi:hypothetical protein